MANYKLSITAKEDLIRIYRYGAKKFGETQAEKYFNNFFEYFDVIAENPYSFEAVDYIRTGYRRCVCGSDSIFYRVNSEKVVEMMTIIGQQDLNSL
ncbi:type II toxin-antitoxin system RelE/ParE family toxin [Mesonia mobilis]|uniref:type II toxin-antitoxin system RelE/ParE family toxin n=1 Tax=Mesonia mobilis TaxID=369791 RepID=UPI0026F0A550|nr:type II toxin-antitoxin system RelE/ParE family toxin [Mesonia mobilis]